MNISIDTLGIYTRLKKANLDDKVAREISNILDFLQNSIFLNLKSSVKVYQSTDQVKA